MAPKPLSELGKPRRHGNGWRAWMYLSWKDVNGPLRGTYDEAFADLITMRGAKTRDDAFRVVEALKTAANVVKQEPLDQGESGVSQPARSSDSKRDPFDAADTSSKKPRLGDAPVSSKAEAPPADQGLIGK